MIEKVMPKVIQNDHTIEVWAITGLIFEIFEGFRKPYFLEDFVIVKKLANDQKHRDIGAKKHRHRILEGGSAEEAWYP